MQGSGPTTLITPPAIEPSSGVWALGSSMGSSMVLVGGALVIVGVYFALVHRQRRRLDSRELAFRSMSHKLGLSRAQINTIRKQSVSMGLASPVGIVMSQELMAQVLRD